MTRVRRMTYDLQGPGAAGIEILTFAQLRRMNDRTTQRGDFHVLGLVRSGRGRLSIDFAATSIGPGDAVWIAPGAVHRWSDIDGLTGHLVLFVPGAPITDAARTAAAGHVPVRRIASDVRRYVDAAVTHLRVELDAPAGERPTGVANLLLSALLERVGRDTTSGPVPGSLHIAFARAVELHFRDHHDVGFYAKLLGYSPRTVTRAVQRNSGTTAKQFIVDRLVLEAKRLLAHDRCAAVACAAQLGFPDASNFSAFFRSNAGVRPGAWQRGAELAGIASGTVTTAAAARAPRPAPARSGR